MKIVDGTVAQPPAPEPDANRWDDLFPTVKGKP